MNNEKLFDLYNRTNMKINRNFIEDFIYEYIKENNLLDYLDNIMYTNKIDAMAGYNDYEKIIFFNEDKIDSEILNLLKIKKISDVVDLYKYNRNFTKLLFHELTHIDQKKIIIEKTGAHKNTINYLNKSFILSEKDPIKYKKYHDLYTLEYNANYNSIKKLNNLLQNLNYIKKEQCDYIIKKFVEKNYMDSSPLEFFNKKLELMDFKIHTLKKVPNKEKIEYGFPIR